MGTISPEGAHICVRCGHSNAAEVSFCVECGFDLMSALQQDYDTYRETSRGDMTSGQGIVLPESVTGTLTGVPAARALENVDVLGPGGFLPGDDPDALSDTAQDTDPTDEDLQRTAGAPAAIIEHHPDPFVEDQARQAAANMEEPGTPEPFSVDTLDDQDFTPGSSFPIDGPTTRPVHENLKAGVTTYVHATQRGFRRPDAPKESSTFTKSLLIALGIGLVVLALALVLTR